MCEYWNTKQAAEYLGVTDRTVRNLCEQRKIKHRRLSARNIQFTKEWLDDYLSSIIIEPDNGQSNLKGDMKNE